MIDRSGGVGGGGGDRSHRGCGCGAARRPFFGPIVVASHHSLCLDPPLPPV
jgi:hypothetical protein